MKDAAGAGTVHVETAEGIGWITISNPARRNALSLRMMSLLESCLRRLDSDPALRVIVLRGAGTSAFAAGADLSELEASQTSADARQLVDTTVATLFDSLGRISIPVLAMIHGHCIGAGVALALGADIRIAADDSQFAIPAVRLGIGYPVPLVHALVHAVGPGHASEILFTGRTLSAHEALEAGLINRVVPALELEDTIRQLTATIATNAPLSVRAAKAAISAIADPVRRPAAETLAAACSSSADAREGQRAFREKRQPVFVGS